MDRNKQNLLVGAALIVFGGLLLVNNLGILGDLSGLLWGGLFGVAALIGFGIYITHRQNWWLLIPSFTLLGVSSVLVVDNLRFVPDELGGATFLLCLSLGFWAIFLLHGEHWWPVIPGGVLAVIAAIVAASIYVRGELVAPILFFGFSLVFGVLWLMRDRYTTGWAIFPAVALFAFALFLAIINIVDDELIGPVVFITPGLVFGLLWLLRDRYRTDWAIYPAAALIGFGLFLALIITFEAGAGALPAIILIAIGAGLLWRNLRQPRLNHNDPAMAGPGASPAFGESKVVETNGGDDRGGN